MSIERPFLTARWTELVMLSFAVPEEVVARLAPPGTVPDLHAGQAYASVIGFMFRDARLLGLRFPGHSLFEEVNLRFYVGRHVDGQFRRGVVFVREIAPRPIVAAVARWVYNEGYVTRPMRSQIELASTRVAGIEAPPSPQRNVELGARCCSTPATQYRCALGAGSRVGYEWRTGAPGRRRWNRVAARAAADAWLPAPGSLEEFIVEHYWAYVRGRDGQTWEYRVAHRPWRVARAAEAVWDCDVAASYGDSPLAPYLANPQAAFIADGSPVQVFRGRRIDAGVTSSKAPAHSAVPSRPVSRSECAPVTAKGPGSIGVGR